MWSRNIEYTVTKLVPGRPSICGRKIMTDPLAHSKIYIVDDDIDNREVLETYLGYAGFTNITMAENGAKALDLVEQQLPDLILLDINMPKMDGYQVIEHIRKRYPAYFIPIVLISALSRPEDRVKGIEVGANDFLNKPYDGAEIVARVRSLLSHKRDVDALHAEQARTLALLNQISNPAIVTDTEGAIIQINPAAQTHLELDQGVLGRGLGEVFGVVLEDLLLRARERQGSVSGIFTPRTGNSDQLTTFNVSVSPVTEVGYILFWQDITALQEGERARLSQARAETQYVLDDPTITARRERRDAAVLFADLRGFTRLTAEHSPDAVMALLNDIFADMIDVINNHDGLLFDITGDELLAAFNVPYDQDNPLQRALDTAIEMHRTFQSRRAEREKRGMQVGMGIGLNCGPVVLGHVGGHSQMSYTMIGQAINVAHRLVEVAEDRQIVISTELLGGWQPDSADLRRHEMQPMQIKSIPEPVMLSAIELIAPND